MPERKRDFLVKCPIDESTEDGRQSHFIKKESPQSVSLQQFANKCAIKYDNEEKDEEEDSYGDSSSDSFDQMLRLRNKQKRTQNQNLILYPQRKTAGADLQLDTKFMSESSIKLKNHRTLVQLPTIKTLTNIGSKKDILYSELWQNRLRSINMTTIRPKCLQLMSRMREAD